MIHVRFDLLYSLSNNYSVTLYQQDLPQVPGVGDIVNIKGNPFRVIRVGWALGDNDDSHALYAYVDVSKAVNFELVLGGKNY